METIHQIKAVVEEEHAFERDGGTEESAASNGNKKAGKQTKKGKAKKKPPPSKEEQYDRLGRLYVRYYGLLRQLEQWHDGAVQPQIRQDVKTILELVICRILALRRCLVELLSDDGGGGEDRNHWKESLPFPGCIDVVNILHDVKLSPSAMKPVIPRYVREESEKRRRELRLSIGDVGCNEAVSVSSDGSEDSLSAKENDMEEEREESQSTVSSKINTAEFQPDSNQSPLTENEAATKVQSVARGHIGRIQTEHHRDHEAVFVGMKLGDNQKANELQHSSQYARQKRKEKQRENNEAYTIALDELRDEVRKEEGSAIYERLYEERMRWISEQITATQSIPETLEAFYLKDGLNGDGDSKVSGGAPNGKDATKKGEESTGPEEVDDSPNRVSQVLDDLLRAVGVFEERWEGKLNDSGACDKEVAKDTIIREEIMQSTTKTVDEAVLLYLQRLRASNDTSGGKKGGKSCGTKKKGAKKGGAGGNKKKKEKPLPGEKLCGSMTAIDMLDALQNNGMVEDCSQNQIDRTGSNFVGSTDAFSSGEKSRSSTTDGWDRQDPTMNQLKLAISEYCILPNASSTTKELISDDDNVRAILFHGPGGCGKRSMVKAVANQLGALLISLSPKLIEDSFLDKSEATRLVHMVFTIARDERYGPIVLHIDECEHFFQSSTGKQVDKNGPLRFQKDLLFYKNQTVQKKDRFIIIGTTAHPELLDSKIIKHKGHGGKPEKQGMFEKILFFPLPDYVDRLLLWKTFLSKYARETSKVQRNGIDFSLLASKSKGFSAGSIERCVELARKAFSETNMLNKENRVLSEVDLLRNLETTKAVGDEDRSRFINFTKSMEQKPKINSAVNDSKTKGKGRA